MSIILSCSAATTPSPTITPKNPPTTIPPTYTSTPSFTATPEPTYTPTEEPPTPTEVGFILPLPEGDPVSNWNGVPIMPGAIKGEESESDAYIFTIQSGIDDIQAFYIKELPKSGWDLLAVGEGDTNNVIMIFMGEKGTFTVSILIVDESDSLLYVMLLES